jgi:HEAT repeat protein
MALYRAGEKLRTKPLLAIAAGDKHLERRLVAILALREAGPDREAGKTLVKLLDESNSEVRTAAICALRGSLPPDAVPKLKAAIDALDPPQAMLFIFDVLGEYKSREANEALAGFLGAALEDRAKAKHLSYALRAFESATGKSWSNAARSEDQLRANARAAVEWWKTEGRQKSE